VLIARIPPVLTPMAFREMFELSFGAA